MNLLEGVALSRLCDYSFVEESAQWGNIFSPFMKPKLIGLQNHEFQNKCREVKKQRDYMTLFVDNIRLYKRELYDLNDDDKQTFEHLMQQGTVLDLCSFVLCENRLTLSCEVTFRSILQLYDVNMRKYMLQLYYQKNATSMRCHVFLILISENELRDTSMQHYMFLD